MKNIFTGKFIHEIRFFGYNIPYHVKGGNRVKKYVILVATTLVLTVGIFYRMSAVSEAIPVKTATVEKQGKSLE